MDRRTFVRSASTLGVVGLAGCSLLEDDSSENGSDRPQAAEPDEYPEGVDDGEMSGENEDDYALYSTGGQDVPLAPTADAYDWYRNGDLVVADARSQSAYQNIHVEGAVWSPAPDGQSSADPLADLPSDQRILTYCTCPHHLSGARAASLLADGYENVYALDKGLNDWIEQGHPIAGDRVE